MKLFLLLALALLANTASLSKAPTSVHNKEDLPFRSLEQLLGTGEKQSVVNYVTHSEHFKERLERALKSLEYSEYTDCTNLVKAVQRLLAPGEDQGNCRHLPPQVPEGKGAEACKKKVAGDTFDVFEQIESIRSDCSGDGIDKFHFYLIVYEEIIKQSFKGNPQHQALLWIYSQKEEYKQIHHDEFDYFYNGGDLNRLYDHYNEKYTALARLVSKVTRDAIDQGVIHFIASRFKLSWILRVNHRDDMSYKGDVDACTLEDLFILYSALGKDGTVGVVNSGRIFEPIRAHLDTEKTKWQIAALKAWLRPKKAETKRIKY